MEQYIKNRGTNWVNDSVLVPTFANDPRKEQIEALIKRMTIVSKDVEKSSKFLNESSEELISYASLIVDGLRAKIINIKNIAESFTMHNLDLINSGRQGTIHVVDLIKCDKEDVVYSVKHGGIILAHKERIVL